uniref:Reverse transcriptase domain-containing protein n=1 Tax=Peronospora matthiolae TaxID=2874970 RepID=A0AAV1V009_9STRA
MFLSESVPRELPKIKGTRHEIELKPGSEYCVMNQWPLPREQVTAIDQFFSDRLAAGHVRESTSSHSSPTFCVRKAIGGWRIVHAFNKPNAATVPAQTPIPRKDVIIDGMAKSTIFSSMDLMNGFYRILMRERNIPDTAVSTPSGMLWEWLVMPQELSNAPTTFNRCVTNLLRSARDFAPSYFDDFFVHIRPMDGKTDVEAHRIHVRDILTLVRGHKLLANLKKCIFAANEISYLDCSVGKNGVRPDPEKIKAISDWPVPVDVKVLRKFLGGVLAQILAQLCRDDRTSLSFVKEKREVVMER